jgi:hypothetical protein
MLFYVFILSFLLDVARNIVVRIFYRRIGSQSHFYIHFLMLQVFLNFAIVIFNIATEYRIGTTCNLRLHMSEMSARL